MYGTYKRLSRLFLNTLCRHILFCGLLTSACLFNTCFSICVSCSVRATKRDSSKRCSWHILYCLSLLWTDKSTFLRNTIRGRLLISLCEHTTLSSKHVSRRILNMFGSHKTQFLRARFSLQILYFICARQHKHILIRNAFRELSVMLCLCDAPSEKQ